MDGSEWYAQYKCEGGRQLRTLLMDNWDPIGVRGIPEAINEYDTYAGRIADSLRRGADVESVSAMLSTYRVDWMSLEPNPGTDVRAALAIVDWYANAMRAVDDLNRQPTGRSGLGFLARTLGEVVDKYPPGVNLSTFLATLDGRRVTYRLDRVRDSIMVCIATPGSRWEIEFTDGGTVEVERFRSDGTMGDERAIDELLAELE